MLLMNVIFKYSIELLIGTIFQTLKRNQIKRNIEIFKYFICMSTLTYKVLQLQFNDSFNCQPFV